MSKIAILLVDDHTLVRQGLRSLLALESDFEVVGEAGSGAEALRLLDIVRPDVVLLDLRMADVSGSEVCRRAAIAHPEIPLLVLTAFAHEREVIDCISAGAKGYMLKDVDVYDLARAIRAIHRGEAVVDSKVAQTLMRRVCGVPEHAKDEMALTEHEREIVRLIAQGLTNKEIGQKLFLSPNTVKFHISNIMQKLGVRRRAEVAFRVSLSPLA